MIKNKGKIEVNEKNIKKDNFNKSNKRNLMAISSRLTTALLIFLMIFILAVLIITPIINASSSPSRVFWSCFGKGEVIKYCETPTYHHSPPTETCTDDGGCSYCMSVYKENEDCYIHGSWPKCMQLPPSQCSDNGGPNQDLNPPNITLTSPLNNSLFTSRVVPFKFFLNEKADVYYIDLINGRGKWIRVCRGCSSFDNNKNFNEGLNQILIKATDGVGNEGSKEVSFFIDSKMPKIKKTFPKKGFADGDFIVEFQEENPRNLTLFYGINQFKTKNINLGTCTSKKNKYSCETNVNLLPYNNQQIEYYFTLIDIAGNYEESKHLMLNVDVSDPIFNNQASFWSQNEPGSKDIFFDLDINEPNFDEVVYSYLDSRGKVKEKRLCSKLTEGKCVKKESFKAGVWDLTLIIRDQAGNSAGYPVHFVVD